MADNILINAPTVVGGKTVSTTEDAGGFQHENVIIEWIDGGGQPVKTSAANPLPVSATINTAGLATESKQDDEILALNSIAGEDFATQATLAALLAKVITAPSTEAKQDAMITLLTTIAAITQPLTDVQLRATPVPVSGTVSTGLTQPLTDTQLRATPVPISGTVSVTGGGDATASNQATQITAEQAIQAAVQIMDDWDESDRAKVNLIVGQAGIAAGTGTDGATVPRVTLATNVALPAGNNNIGDVDVATLPALVAGSAIIGKVGIDQTTPGTTNLVALAANQSVNVAQLAGTTTDTNSGNKSAGTLRVVLATDQPALTNALQVKSTQKPSIGATVVLAVTALQSLASSATVGWGSVRVSNLATLATDYEIMVKLTTANTAPANDKAMYVFVVPWYTSDAGTTWFASSQGTTTLPSGTDAAATIASPHNLRLLGVLNYTTAQMVVQDTFLLSNCFGNRLPDGFSITIINFSGAALSTGCIVDYSPLNDILV